MRATPTFLLAGLSAVSILALAACGGSGDDEGGSSPQPTATDEAAATGTTPGNGTTSQPEIVNGLPGCVAPGTAVEGSPFEANENPIAGGQPNVKVVAASADIYAGENNLAIGITTMENQPIGGAQVRLTIYDLSSGEKPVCQVEGVASAPGVGPESEHLHPGGEIHIHGGEDEDRAVHYARVDFARAGNWGLAVEAILPDGSAGFGTLLLQVGQEPQTPAPGDDAIKSDNLTKDDVDDISEIDSGDPPNDMHDLKIRDVVDAGRPLVIVFSTPAYCSTAFCGPVNQEVETLQDDYREKVDFIHIEIYRDFTAGTFNPTAREWLARPDGGLSEPVVYIVGKDGVIFDRFDGPAARNVLEPSVQAVADGAVWEDR